MSRKTADWIQSYLKYTDNSEPPLLYREWVAVSVIAAALRRKVYLQWGSLSFFPNLYVVLVGPPGKCRKGTAMGEGARLLREVGIDLAAESITREALIEQLAHATKEELDSEAENTTYLHASLTIYSQELAVFLGQGNLRLLMDLTDWYDCRDVWKYDTKNSGKNHIMNVWVNLIGATTPEQMQTMFPQDAIGGGLASRIIFIYEDQKSKIVPFPFPEESELRLRDDLVLDLEYLSTLSGPVGVSEEFCKEWEIWYRAQHEQAPFEDNPKFAGYVERRGNHLLKLCIIMAASMNSLNSNNQLYVTTEVFNRALDLLLRTEIKMPRTFEGYGSSKNVEVTTRVMDFIRQKRSLLQNKELLAAFYMDVANKQELEQIVEMLVGMGYCSRVMQRDDFLLTYIPPAHD